MVAQYQENSMDDLSHEVLAYYNRVLLGKNTIKTGVPRRYKPLDAAIEPLDPDAIDPPVGEMPDNRTVYAPGIHDDCPKSRHVDPKPFGKRVLLTGPVVLREDEDELV